MIPILKKGKNKSKAESYRPISLTSSVGKTNETPHRHKTYAAPWDITPDQAACRQNRSTEDQIACISQAIEDAFQDKKYTLSV